MNVITPYKTTKIGEASHLEFRLYISVYAQSHLCLHTNRNTRILQAGRMWMSRNRWCRPMGNLPIWPSVTAHKLYYNAHVVIHGKLNDIVIQGVLNGDCIGVKDGPSAHKLGLDGYGDDEEDGYNLKPFEALYLMAINRMSVTLNKTPLGFDDLLEACQEEDPDILSKYLIYRDLRTRGYVAKDGFGFGMDFRVYDRGDFGVKGARFLVFGLNQGKRKGAREFCDTIDDITRMGKEPVVAVIESRGEIIYYKTNRITFENNKP